MGEYVEALRKVLLYLGVKADNAALDKTKAKVDKTTASAKAASAGFAKFGGAIQGLVGLVAGGAIFDAIVGQTARAGDEAAKTSQRVGVTAESYQRLRYAADLSGASVEQLNVGLVTLSRSAQRATQAGSAQDKAFRSLGVSVLDSSGQLKRSDVLLEELAERFKAMPDGVEKTALAAQLFGESGVKLIPMLNAGAEGIRAMGDEAEQLGVVMSGDQAKSTEQYNDAMTRLRSVLVGLRNTLALALMPILTKAAERFTLWWRQGEGARRFVERFQKGAKLLALALGAKAAWQGAQLLAAGISAIGKAGALASAKLALITGSLVLLALLLEDLYVFMSGGDSLIGSLLGAGEAEALRTSLGQLGEALGEIWRQLSPQLAAAAGAAIKWLGENASKIATVIGAVVVGAVEAVRFAINAVLLFGENLGKAAAWLYLAWEQAVEWSAQKIGELVNWLSSLGVAWEDMGAAGKIALGVVALALSPILGVVGIVWGLIEAFKSLWGWLEVAGAAIGDFFSGLSSGISDTFGAAIEGLLDTLRDIVLAMPSKLVPQGLTDWALAGVDASTGTGLGGAAARLVSPEQAAAVAASSQADGAGIGALAQQLVSRSANVSLGQLTVNVQGSADMTAPEMQAAVKNAAKGAFEDLIANAYSDLEAVA